MATAKLTSKSKNDEKALISNEYHETSWVAKKFNVPVWYVYMLKHYMKTNNRKKIYEAIERGDHYLTVSSGVAEIPKTAEKSTPKPL